jgi:hypothetical protein
MSTDLHAAGLDALYRRDHGLPAEPGDDGAIADLDRYLSDAHDRAVAVAYDEFQAALAAQRTEDE